MHQHQPSDPDPDDDLEQLGEPIYQGDGLQVRGLTEEDLARFLAAHAGQPARLVGSGWNHLKPTEAPPLGSPEPAGPLAVAGPPRGSYGAPGASAARSTGGCAPPSWPAGAADCSGGCRWLVAPASARPCSPARCQAWRG